MADQKKRITWYDTIVVGGGQAGLAIGHELAARDIDFLILDAGRSVGDSWRHRWDSLRLFTPARYSGLPGMSFPDSPMHLPDKDQVADYFATYAERFELPIRLSTRVTSLSMDGEQFHLHTTNGVFISNNVVIATGPFQRPRVPSITTQLSPDIHQLHSSEYRNPFELPDGPALVVGAGNSGAQIALELSRSRKVTLAGRDIGYLPRTIFGADIFRWIWPTFRHFTVDTWFGRRLRDRDGATDPLIGTTPGDFRSNGIERVGRVTEVRDGWPIAGGVEVRAKTVIWATGFTPDFSWIQLPVIDSNGVPLHRRGVTRIPGLYFLGLRFQYRQTSALIGGVGDDAGFIAADIVGRRSEGM